MSVYRVMISRRVIDHTVVLVHADSEADARARVERSIDDGDMGNGADVTWEQDDYEAGPETVDVSTLELPPCCDHPDWVSCSCTHHGGGAVMYSHIDNVPVSKLREAQ